MLISRKHNFIFIHIYKNAGTSISTALLPHCTNSTVYWMDRIFHRFGVRLGFGPRPFPGHIRAVQISELLSPHVFDSYFSFAFARNPWDWQVSLYSYMLKNTSHHQHELISQLGSFENYLLWLSDKKPAQQRDFVCNEEGDCLVNFVGRFENLNEDFSLICEKLNIKASLPKMNISNEHAYQKFYNERTRQIVQELFATDIEYFNYNF